MARKLAKVVVGIDGSEAAAKALQWVTNKGHIFGDVTPVTAYQIPVNFDLMTRPPTGVDLAVYRDAADARLTRTVTEAAPQLLDRATLINSRPGVGLVDAAANSDLLVVGTTGHNALAAALLGSTSTYCVNHSGVPVALIPPTWNPEKPLSTVVVGMDGSQHANDALRWVMQNVAPHLGSEGKIVALGAVSVWGYMETGYEPPLADLQARLEETIRRSVSEIVGPFHDGPMIEIVTDPRDARVALRDTAETEGDLLVVGARGLSGVAHLLLGSVATALAHHPTVPTIVVPIESED
ncbi:MAG: universal stress protein [Acidimicrobiales bacterium]